MNKYIVAVYHYFSGYHNFIVNGENKADALMKAKLEAERLGNYNTNDAKVIKKVKKDKCK